MKVNIHCNSELVSAYVQAAIRITGTGGINPDKRDLTVNISPFYFDLLVTVCEAAACEAGGYPYDVRVSVEEGAAS